MKTVPFNESDAKAGRPVVLDRYIPLKFIHAYEDKVWAIRHGDLKPLTFDLALCSHPAEPAPGNNNHDLDAWDVGGGWRLLVLEEIRDRDFTCDIQQWLEESRRWSQSPARGCDTTATYRTRKPPGFFLPKTTKRNIRQDELPVSFLCKSSESTWVVVRNKWNEARIEQAVRDGEVWSRSLDGPWRSFTVEETK